MRDRTLWSSLLQDLSHSWRGLLRARGFAATTITLLALGIGANAVMFGIVDRLLLRPPQHVRDANKVWRVYVARPGGGSGPSATSYVSYASYADLAAGSRSFSSIAAYNTGSDGVLGLGVDATPIKTGFVTAGFFPLLGVQAEAGRFFRADEDVSPLGAYVAVLSHELWTSRFHSDVRVIGTVIAVNNEQFTIIGIAPPEFTGSELERVDVWMPASVRNSTGRKDWASARGFSWLQMIGRLNAGTSPAQAAVEALGVYERGNAMDNRADSTERIRLLPLSYTNSGEPAMEASVSQWLLGVAAIMLVIVCANVANVLLARGIRRRREIAVRVALGAGRVRIVSLLLMESVLIAVAGAGLGLAVAWWGGQFARTTLLPNVQWGSPVDLRVLGVTAGVALVASVLAGLVPALRASRPDLVGSLKAGGHGSAGASGRLRFGLLMAQAASSVVLLVGAGLFVRSLWTAQSLHLGIQPDRVLVAGFYTRALNVPPDEQARWYNDALRRASAMPGVEHASLTTLVPLSSTNSMPLRVPGRDSIPNLGSGPFVNGVGADYFATVGTRVVRGRAMTSTEVETTAPVVLINETMARTLWPAEDPVGRCLLIGADATDCSQVVGVVEDSRRFRLTEKPAMQYYVPLGKERSQGRALLVRTAGDPTRLVERLRHEVELAAPTATFVRIRTLDESLASQFRPWRLGAIMFTVFGVLALIVAAAGLYGVVAYGVAQRTEEFGIRMALGARGYDIAGTVVRGGFAAIGIGVGVGLLASLAAGHFVEGLLFQTSARNPVIYAAVALAFLLIALLASVIPVRRAVGVNPATALRGD